MKSPSLTVYKASAGSGKTYALTREYILALIAVKNPDTGVYRLNHPLHSPSGRALTNRHRGILAITFTNKATEEMKERITTKLRDLSFLPAPGAKDADYAADFTAMLGCSRQHLAQAAEAALKQLLHDFQNFNVSTIDSFFQRVLRVFARELDRQGDYEVELNHAAVMRAAVAQMLDDFNLDRDSSSELTRWIKSRMRESIAQGKRANILDRNSVPHRQLVEVIGKITSEDFADYAEQMRLYLDAEPSLLAKYIKALRERGAAIDEEIRSTATEAIAAVEAYGPKHGVSAHALNFLRNNFTAEIKKPAKDPLANALARIPDGLRTKKCICPDSVVDAVGTATIRCVELLQLREDLAKMAELADQLHFLKFAWNYVNAIYQANNTLLLADTNSLIRRIIDGSDVPFIYERLGMQLHHFLIDEFQDTSVLQWENLKPLVANAVADRHDSLIIGDVKQSIYGFRNSAPSLLQTQVENDDFPGLTIARGSSVRDNTNHRSAREVVLFNNSLFTRLAARAHAVGYENVAQALPPGSDVPGYVRIFNDTAPEDAKASPDPFADAPQLATMVAEMTRQHDQGGYAWSDIAILSSRHSDNARAIEYILRHTSIPVLAEDGLYLHKSAVIQLIIALLRLVDVKQTSPAPTLASSRFFSMADMQLIMSRFEYFSTVDGLDPAAALESALGSAGDLDAVVTAILGPAPASVAELVENVILRFIPPATRDRNAAYLTALQDVIAEYARSTPETLHGFLQWWDDKAPSLSIPVGGDIDAVRVMTVHKSKGLEFDCVHIPFPAWAQWSMKGKEWETPPVIDGIDPELVPPALLIDGESLTDRPESVFYPIYTRRRDARASEQVNVTYVAYTRAARELCIYALTQTDKKSSSKDEPPMIDAVIECLSAPAALTEDDSPLTIDLAAHFSPDTGTFSLGEPTRKIHKASTPSHVAELPALHPGYPVWPRTDSRVLSSPDSPQELSADVSDQPAAGPNADDYDFDPESRERGLLMHEILQNVTTAADLPAAAAAVAARGHFPASDVRAAARALEKALDLARPELARWFRDFTSVVCEQAIYIHEGSTDTTRRPDRIIFNPDGSAEVIDYKFTSRARASHIEQVRLYCRLLRAMGHERVRGHLWYPLQPGSPAIEVTLCPNE